MMPVPKSGPRGLSRFGLMALAGLALAACEYPASAKVAPDPVAYVRPAPTAPFAPAGPAGSRSLSPYVAVTIPPPAPTAPGTPVGQSTAGALPPGETPPIPTMGYLVKPKTAPVVTVPAYTAPVYGPAGSRAGY